MWQVHGSQRVAKLLDSFDRRLHERYVNAFERLAKEPNAGKLLQGYEDLRSFPITTKGGEHRIIYRLKPNERIIYIVLVGSRESIYELLKRRNK